MPSAADEERTAAQRELACRHHLKKKKKKNKNKKGHTQIFSIFCPMIIPLFIGAFWALWVHNSTFEGTVGVQKLTCSKGYCNVPVWCTFVLQKVQFCSTFSESERYF